MVSEEAGAKGLPEPSCVGFGFEALDCVADALICPAARPFGLGRERFVDVWQAAELQAQFGGLQAFTAGLVVFL